MTLWRWLLCRLNHHEGVLETTPDRLRLRCLHCQKVSESWEIEKAAGTYDKLASRRVLRLVKKRA